MEGEEWNGDGGTVTKASAECGIGMAAAAQRLHDVANFMSTFWVEKRILENDRWWMLYMFSDGYCVPYRRQGRSARCDEDKTMMMRLDARCRFYLLN